MTELLGDAESAQAALYAFAAVRDASREKGWEAFVEIVKSAIDQAKESRNAEVDALIAERDAAQSMLRWTYQELGSEEKLDQSAPLNHLVRRKLEALRTRAEELQQQVADLSGAEFDNVAATAEHYLDLGLASGKEERDELAQKLAQAEALRAALKSSRKYLRHSDGCNFTFNVLYGCNCGLRALKTEIDSSLAQATITAEIRAAEQAQAERDAVLCETLQYEALSGGLQVEPLTYRVINAGDLYAKVIRAASAAPATDTLDDAEHWQGPGWSLTPPAKPEGEPK